MSAYLYVPRGGRDFASLVRCRRRACPESTKATRFCPPQRMPRRNRIRPDGRPDPKVFRPQCWPQVATSRPSCCTSRCRRRAYAVSSRRMSAALSGRRCSRNSWKTAAAALRNWRHPDSSGREMPGSRRQRRSCCREPHAIRPGTRRRPRLRRNHGCAGDRQRGESPGSRTRHRAKADHLAGGGVTGAGRAAHAVGETDWRHS